jgi:uncharacterized repeat protein (TIGR03803 family)
VFKLSSAGKLTNLVSFANTNGSYPPAGLTLGSGGNFYGTTYSGGANGFGTIFMMTPAGQLTTLISFANSDGRYPLGALLQASDGNFYGTTFYGGTNAVGTVFRVVPASLPTTPADLQLNLYPGLTLQGTVGGRYQIEYNTDLTTTNWIPLTTIMLPSSPYLYVDTNSPAVANRFYRAVGLQY